MASAESEQGGISLGGKSDGGRGGLGGQEINYVKISDRASVWISHLPRLELRHLITWSHCTYWWPVNNNNNNNNKNVFLILFFLTPQFSTELF